jgi:hypothetical protein
MQISHSAIDKGVVLIGAASGPAALMSPGCELPERGPQPALDSAGGDCPMPKTGVKPAELELASAHDR